MASQYIDLPVGNGVTSLNGLTGALTLVAGTGISITPAGSNITITNTGGTGTVTSVALTVPAFLSVAGSPITTSGTLAVSLSGTALPVANGGTGVTSLGNLTDAGTDGIVVTGGTGAVITSVSLAQHVADSTHNGYLSSTDWNTFNGKQASGNYITALTGDGSASGPGSVAFTLATVNGNVGSFGSSTAIPSFTVNAKGLVTAASTNVVIAPAGTLTGTTLAANVVTSSLTSVGTIATGVWQGTAVGAQYGGTGINTSASTGVPSISSGTWSVSTTLNAAQFPILTGDITTTGGSLSTTAAATQSRITSLSATGGVFVHGQNNNTAAAAGFIGEIFSINRLRSNAVSVTNNTAFAVGTTTSVTLTAGNWMIGGAIGYIPAGGTTFQFTDVILNTSVATPATDTIGNPTAGIYWQLTGQQNLTLETVIALSDYIVNVANGNTLQLFLVGRAQFLVGTVTAYGNMWAHRLF